MKMKKIALIKELEKYPVFSLKTVKEIIKKSDKYAKLVAFRLKKEGLIFEIEKNKYTVNKNAFIVASNIVWPCYLSFWTALRYHNLTEQLPKDIFVITTRARKKRELVFNKTKIIFVRIKPKYFFGFTKERHDGFDVFMAESEKALIDSVLFKEISFSEIGSIIRDNFDRINKNKLIEYLLKINDKALIKRFGFLLDQLGLDFFDKLKKHLGYNYIHLDYAMPKKGKKNKKWRIVENVKL